VRVEARRADAPLPECEGVDIAPVGIIDELPQPSDPGTRFAFAVERLETIGPTAPMRLSLSWNARLKKDGTIGAPPPLDHGRKGRAALPNSFGRRRSWRHCRAGFGRCNACIDDYGTASNALPWEGRPPCLAAGQVRATDGCDTATAAIPIGRLVVDDVPNERSAEVNPCTSNCDHYLKCQAGLGSQEANGLEPFEGKAMSLIASES
jgi:hypothetical protein